MYISEFIRASLVSLSTYRREEKINEIDRKTEGVPELYLSIHG